VSEPQEEQVQEAIAQMQQMNTQAPPADTQSPLKQAPPPPALPQPKEANPASGLLQFLHLDSDALLILPLLLLLMREGADDKLVLALLYILL